MQKCKLSDFLREKKLNSKIISEIKEEILCHDSLGIAVIDVEMERAAFCDSPINIMLDHFSEITATVMTIKQLEKEITKNMVSKYDCERFARSIDKDTLKRKLKNNKLYSFVARSYDQNSKYKVVKYSFVAIDNEQNIVLWSMQDITHTLEYDILTGGLNRSGFLFKLQDILEKNQNEEYSLLFFNIQSFHHINELYGMEAGDAVLQHLYTKISCSPLQPLLYARSESDHFYCLLPSSNVNTEYILQLCRNEANYEGKNIPFHCLCGIYKILDHGETPANMCGRASIAANYVHDAYKTPWKEFDENMRLRYISDGEVVDQLEYALANHEFKPYFQPIVNARTGRIEMAEALARWNSARYGFVSPADFIPSLEKHGSISRVDMFMEKRVYDLQRSRMAQGLPVVPIDVNVSWVDFGDAEYVNQLEKHLKDNSEIAKMCRYEITESTIAEIAENRHELLKVFSEYNRKLIIDDFGKGYSFSTMRDIEFSTIKLDKSLIDKIGQNTKADFLVESLITMFHKMGAKVVGEGVEQQYQADYLKQIGCDYIQGFLYYRPMPEKEFVELLNKQVEEIEKEAKERLDDNEDSRDISNAVWIERDILEGQYEKLKQSVEEANCLRMLLDSQHIHYFEWDPKTHIDVCSDSFKQLYNLPTNDIPNMPENADLCYPEDRDAFRNFYKRAAQGELMGTDYFRIFNPDGNSYSWYRKTFYTIFDKNHRPYKVILTMQDCTDKYNFRALRKRNELLVCQQEVITFIYTTADDVFEFTYLQPNGEVSSKKIPNYLATPRSEQGFDQKILAAQLVEKLNSDVKSGYIDFYDKRFNQELRAHYSKVESEKGNIYAIVGQAENIHRTRERLEKTIASQKEFISVTEGLSKIYNAVTTANLTTGVSRIVLLDKSYEGHLSIDMEWDAVADTYVKGLLLPKHREAFVNFMRIDTVKERLKGNRYISLEYEDSIIGWIRGYILPSGYDADGNITQILFASQPIGSEKNTIDRLVYLSETDGLTGLRNRYSGEIQIERAIDEECDGVFAIIDCDKFKEVNDTFGHIVGDDVLVKIAEVLRTSNEEGITMRLGGDEFALYIYGNKSDEEIIAIFDNLFDKIKHLHVEGLGDTPIAVSAGAVRYNSKEKADFDSLYRKADNLLYKSKKTKGCKLSFK